jgi:hypothetical protein
MYRKNIQWVNVWISRFKAGHCGENDPAFTQRPKNDMSIDLFQSPERKGGNWDLGPSLLCLWSRTVHRLV